MARRRRRHKANLTGGVVGTIVFVALFLGIWPTLRAAFETPIFWQLFWSVLVALMGLGAAMFFAVRRIVRWKQNIDEAKRYRFVIKRESMLALHHYDFEHYVAWLYKQQGYIATVSEQSGDHGIDVYLKKTAFDPKPLAAIQVKQYSDNITEENIRSFYGSYKDETERGIFVTTSDFTQPAREWAQSREVELVNGTQLVAMAQKYGLPQSLKDRPQKTEMENIASRILLTESNIRDAHKKGCINDWQLGFMLKYMNKQPRTKKECAKFNEAYRQIRECV